MLIHWPGTQKLALNDPQNMKNRLGTYRALEEAHDKGLIRHLGVSNFTVSHLEHLLEYARIPPYLNQIELHPLLMQSDIVEYCRDRGIRIQSYSTLGEGRFLNDPEFQLESVNQLAIQKNKTKAQILLRWAIQEDYLVIPKASSEARLLENFDIFSFELSLEVLFLPFILEYECY
jgi:diketogulonate reductase-like aldo/keto reductase